MNRSERALPTRPMAWPALAAGAGALVLGLLIALRPAETGSAAGLAQSADPCPPARIHLPWIQRGRGVPHIPVIIPRPTPDVRRPCPSATPGEGPITSPSPTPGIGTPSSTPGGGTSTPSGGTIEPTATGPTPTITGGASATPSLVASATASPELTPTEPPSPTATPTRTRLEGIFGIQAFERDLEPLAEGRFEDAGATWVRIRALWAGIEPEDSVPRSLDWSSTDSMIWSAAARGLKPVVVIYSKPPWAASVSCAPMDRAPVSRFAAFMVDLVERYDGDGFQDAPGSPVVRHWEIGNEPDLSQSLRNGEDYGSCYGDDPEAYGEELRAAYLAAKAADPEARVLFGPVAYDRFHDNEDFSPAGPFTYGFVREVLDSLYSNHGEEAGWPFFDLMAFHNYNDFRNNWDGPVGENPEILGKVAHLRAQQMVAPGRFDLSAMPVFASEVGLPSGPSDGFTERSEDYQAAYVGRVMTRAMAGGLLGAVWYTFSDEIADASDPDCDELYYWLVHGLMRTSWVAEAAAGCPENPLPGYVAPQTFTPKPANAAMRVLGERLNGARFDRKLDASETGDVRIEAYRFIRDDGDALLTVFTDHGERLGRRGTAALRLPFTVDAALLPGYAGRLRVIDHLGAERIELGERVTLTLSHAPLYLVVAP